MKTNYKFANLCGTVYREGNLVFTKDGSTLLSPVGNRVSVFDLVNNQSYTLPCETKQNIAQIALSPNDALLLAIDQSGRAILVNFQRRVLLSEFNFKSPVRHVQFSPDGRFFAVTIGKQVQVWRAPGLNPEFAPFVHYRTYPGHFDDVTSIQWSPDSRYFVSGSKDMTCRLYSLDAIEGFGAVTLTGHKAAIVNAFFSKDQKTIYTISRDANLFAWRCKLKRRRYNSNKKDADTESDEEESDVDVDEEQAAAANAASQDTPTDADAARIADARNWKIAERRMFKQNYARVVCATFQPRNGLLCVGFASGVFGIWEMPDFNNIHTLSISQHRIDTCAVNHTGEWLAFGSAKLGQLLVWEWQSETYVLKQQGHYYDMDALAYAPDGQHIATGGADGKVKLWNSTSGFCFITFADHTAGVTAVEFVKQGQVVVSASLDGTVRAYDMTRYRNFRTFLAPEPKQFTSLACDPSGEIICAGTRDSFEIYVWSMQTGRLLDVLAGHEGPVSALAFSPTDNVLASGSWDRTVRTWDVFGRGRAVEVFQHQAEVLAIAYRPDGRHIAATTLNGEVTFWDAEHGRQLGVMDVRRDIALGRRQTDRRATDNRDADRYFNSICYTADGRSLLGGGNCRFVCLYDVDSRALLRRFELSRNFSYDGIRPMLNSKRMTEAGSTDLVDANATDSDDDEERRESKRRGRGMRTRRDEALPGVQAGDLSLRTVKPEMRTKAVRFSPTGRCWAAAATDGLVIFSLDDLAQFDPLELDMELTPEAVLESLHERAWLRAMAMAIRLNDVELIRRSYEAVPPSDIALVAKSLPIKYLERLLRFIAEELETSRHLHFHLLWSVALLNEHATYLRDHARHQLQPTMRALRKGLSRMHEALAKTCHENTYLIRYLLDERERMERLENDMAGMQLDNPL
ncbi:WD40 repeat-like protein [Syncephalis pseudoplumigaleata]|uniref:WD40 repeat-like protein n=1 Tax=Syncephalis pseudoplumigaleata TaxID=1712513 RepID=A0A4P9YXB4_9FUNG|nr:WD40 repeat-like protein [Syncephalis pseudoplumigaleata]|eukprot:RKP24687.1 WD40 repeat-like protein [Syncephalis pseudoplumigaleata]